MLAEHCRCCATTRISCRPCRAWLNLFLDKVRTQTLSSVTSVCWANLKKVNATCQSTCNIGLDGHIRALMWLRCIVSVDGERISIVFKNKGIGSRCATLLFTIIYRPFCLTLTDITDIPAMRKSRSISDTSPRA